MLIQDLLEGAFRALDTATGGVFSSLRAHCEAHGCEAHLSVQTRLEGLLDDEMKLYVQVVKGDETKDFAIARLEGSAKIIGWDIYLHDRTSSARSYLTRANKKIDLASEASGGELDPQRVSRLEDIVPNQADVPVLPTLH